MRTIRRFWPFAVFAILWVAAKVEVARGEWFEYMPPRSTSQGGIYRETISRCPAYGWKQISSMDKATQCHEATHFIDGDICALRKQSYGAFYVGGGRCFVVAEPNVTVADVVSLLPASKRMKSFGTYLTSDRTSRNALTLLDEWTCYTNDAQCTIELGLPEDGGRDRAIEFCTYVDAVVEAIRRHDPQYPQLSELEQFVAWQKHRLQNLDGARDIRGPGDYQVTDLAPTFRQRNPDGSCVFCSVVMQMRWLGLYEEADEWWGKYRGGETDSGLRRKMLAEGINFAMTSDGDERLLEWAIATRRGAALTWGGAHCIYLIGREDGMAVILDNNAIQRFKKQPWRQFLSEWRRCGGWAFVVLDGSVPAPIPT